MCISEDGFQVLLKCLRGPGDHLSGSLVPQRPSVCPPGPGAGSRAGFALFCSGAGTSVSFPLTPHLEFLLVPLPASRAGRSCLLRFHLRQGLRSARLVAVPLSPPSWAVST